VPFDRIVYSISSPKTAKTAPETSRYHVEKSFPGAKGTHFDAKNLKKRANFHDPRHKQAINMKKTPFCGILAH